MPTSIPQTIAEDSCDRVAFIVDGQIRLIDTPRTLRLRYGKPYVGVEYGENQSHSFPLAELGTNQGFYNSCANAGCCATIRTVGADN